MRCFYSPSQLLVVQVTSGNKETRAAKDDGRFGRQQPTFVMSPAASTTEAVVGRNFGGGRLLATLRPKEGQAGCEQWCDPSQKLTFCGGRDEVSPHT